MKATGIVRRIDDLGRVVIPKEIRRTMGVREGDPLEIGVDGERIVLWKYAPNDTTPVSLSKGEVDLLWTLAAQATDESSLPADVHADLVNKLIAARGRLDQ